MKKHHTLLLLLVAFSLTTLVSCDIIGGIFRAGVWSGIIIVVIVVLLLIFIISKIRGRR